MSSTAVERRTWLAVLLLVALACTHKSGSEAPEEPDLDALFAEHLELSQQESDRLCDCWDTLLDVLPPVTSKAECLDSLADRGHDPMCWDAAYAVEPESSKRYGRALHGNFGPVRHIGARALTARYASKLKWR